MYRFEKKAALVCATASLIVACCLSVTVNVAFAQDSGEAQSIESKVDLPSGISDNLPLDSPSVINDGGNVTSRLEFGITEKTVNTKPAGCKAEAIGIGLTLPMMVQCRLAILM